jgi:alkanesulfonate monooxygenase SsuD/methylene tetrahydromethanopterin reductase-like flavin-dependent oxidoreductase (luciferase family)
MSIDCGFLFPFRNPPFQPRAWADVYREDLDLCVHSEMLGLDHVWLTEHHFVDDGYSPSLLPIATAIAAQTTQVRIGTFVLLLPLHQTVRLAEDIATADLISNGRLDIGVGLGYRVGEFKGMGISPRERAARFKEQLPLLRQLLDGETVTFDGKFHNMIDAHIMPPAVQEPVPIWVGARGDKALDRAARLGCHLAGVAAEHRLKYREALKRHGREPDDYKISQMVLVYVADTKEQAWNDTAEPVNHTLQLYFNWAVEAGDNNNDDQDSRSIPTPDELRRDQSCSFFGEAAFIGTPDFVYEGLRDLLKRSPCTHLVLMGILPGAPHAGTRHSMELFAKEVMPRLKQDSAT